MAPDDEKETLARYLQSAREALVWKLDGLSEYDMRRPVVPTATNLLGLVRHVASVEAGYLGETFGRPFPEDMPWVENWGANDDMWVPAREASPDVIAFYRRVWLHSDETVAALPLDAVGRVPWWPDGDGVTLHRVLVHVATETHRHAGHADIVRELIDGEVGLRADRRNTPDQDETWWASYRARVEAAAREAGGR